MGQSTAVAASPAEPKPQGPGTALASPAEMIRYAMEKGAPLETLEKFMALKERHEATEARKAFNKAFAAFKAEAISILKGTVITDGPLKGKHHADLYDVVSATTTPLARYGLTIAWKTTKDEPAWMEVTCTLKHDDGHVETESMGGAPDTGPGRNAIQARGSTRTYLQRYTAMAILGLAPRDKDDDGAGGKIDLTLCDDKQLGNISSLIDECTPEREGEAAQKAIREKTVLKFLTALSSRIKLKVTRVEDIPANAYQDAVAILNTARGVK